MSLPGIHVTRRSLVGLGLAAAAGVIPVPGSAAAGGAAFVGQSGEPHGGRFFLGLLAASDAGQLRMAVKDIRKATGYFRALRSRSSDRFKLEFSKQVLDHLAARKDTQFTALDIQLPSWPKPGPQRDEMVRKMAEELFALAPSATTIRLVDNHDASNFGHLLSVAEKTAPLGRPVEYALIGQDDLLQLASFLTGLANSGSETRPQSLKGQLIGHLKAQLSVGELNARTLAKRPLFRIRQLSL